MNWRLALAAAAALGLGYAGLIERGRLWVDRQVVVVSRARPDFCLRILHLSDLHVDGHSPFRRWRLRRLAATLQALEFDLLVFSGDLSDDEGGVEVGAAFLGQVAGGRPAFAVLGNHDYHHYPWWQNILNVHTLQECGLVHDIPIDRDVARIARLYAGVGVELLTNRGRLLRLNGAEFWLAGVDDLLMGVPNLNQTVTVEGAPAEAPRVLIAHHPDLFPWAEMAGFDLVLSGHTHGGQIRLPLVGPVLTGSSLQRRMIAGLTRNQRGTLHVSRGLGETIPVRFNCPLHATVLEVRGARAGTSGDPTPEDPVPLGTCSEQVRLTGWDARPSSCQHRGSQHRGLLGGVPDWAGRGHIGPRAIPPRKTWDGVTQDCGRSHRTAPTCRAGASGL